MRQEPQTRPALDNDAALKGFAAASIVFILLGNGLDWPGLGLLAWLALLPSAAVYRLIARRSRTA